MSSAPSNPEEREAIEAVEEAKRILLNIEMQPDRKGKLQVLLHVLAERNLREQRKAVEARIAELTRVWHPWSPEYVEARIKDLKAQLHSSRKESENNNNIRYGEI